MPTSEINQLRERAKELRCLYRVHEIVSERGNAPPQTFLRVLEVIPEGWQRPATTGARIEYLGRSYVGPGYSSSGHAISEPIRLNGVAVGSIDVTDAVTDTSDAEPFLREEVELLRNIAHRLGDYLEWKHTELLGEGVARDAVHWRWRDAYATALAARLDAKRFGVEAMYLGGSTESGSAGPGSDIDLYVRFNGTEQQRDQLVQWLEGWSLCLAELAEQQTGYSFPDGMLNVQWLNGEPTTHQLMNVRELQVNKSK